MKATARKDHAPLALTSALAVPREVRDVPPGPGRSSAAWLVAATVLGVAAALLVGLQLARGGGAARGPGAAGQGREPAPSLGASSAEGARGATTPAVASVSRAAGAVPAPPPGGGREPAGRAARPTDDAPALRRSWPVGEPSPDLALVATNIPPGAPWRATASILHLKSEEYLLVSQGDRWGDLDVVQIAMDWVQLRRGSSYLWVGYKDRPPGRSARHRRRERLPPPRRVRRRRDGPTVTYKWILGRLNLAGELEDHLLPEVTSAGLKIGRVTTGFRRIGLRPGDVVERAGDRRVRSLDDLRSGMQGAARPGGSGTITVLRRGRSLELPFNVR